MDIVIAEIINVLGIFCFMDYKFSFIVSNALNEDLKD